MQPMGFLKCFQVVLCEHLAIWLTGCSPDWKIHPDRKRISDYRILFAIRLKFFRQQSHTITLAQIFDVCRVQQQQLPWRRLFTRWAAQVCLSKPEDSYPSQKCHSKQQSTLRDSSKSVNLKGVGASCMIQLSESGRLARRREDWKRPWSLFSTSRLL